MVAGSGLFSLLTCLHTTTFTLISIFSPLERISIKILKTPLSCHMKCSLPVAVRVSKTRVLKLPSIRPHSPTVPLQLPYVAQGSYTFSDQTFKDFSRSFKGQILKFQGPLFYIYIKEFTHGNSLTVWCSIPTKNQLCKTTFNFIKQH